jgi:hypothetical protein
MVELGTTACPRTDGSLPVPAEHDQVREDDLELLRMAALAYWAFGANQDKVIAAARYFGAGGPLRPGVRGAPRPPPGSRRPTSDCIADRWSSATATTSEER